MNYKTQPQTRSFTVSVDQKSLEYRIDALIAKIEKRTKDDINSDEDAVKRIRRALTNRFRPYLLEAEIIAQQLLTSEYANFKEETRDFFGMLVNVVACPDGRISVLSLTDPRIAYVHRVPRGQLPTRLSTGKEEVTIPENVGLRAGVWTALKRLRRKTKVKPALVTLMGPHINSSDPIHGCGGAAEDLSGIGSGLPGALATLRYGGARNYFRTLQKSDEYNAFDHFVRIAGGAGATIDYVHDLYSQGVIIGLGKAWKRLKKSQALRENLIRLHMEEKIVMSEFLVKKYSSKILKYAKALDSRFTFKKPLDYRDPKKFALNAMLIGRIARQLTFDEERNNMKVLPKYLRKAYPKKAYRVLLYHLLRNVVYLSLGGIQPGKHWLIHHPEQLLRVGSIGADFNVKTIAFIETTPPTFSKGDMQTVFVLYRLMEHVLPTMDVDLEKEARVIMVTGNFDQSVYVNDDAIEEAYDQVKTMVVDNAAQVKMLVKRAVSDGAVVVIPMIHHTGNRSVIDVI